VRLAGRCTHVLGGAGGFPRPLRLIQPGKGC
jgi:hypothetical protein